MEGCSIVSSKRYGELIALEVKYEQLFENFFEKKDNWNLLSRIDERKFNKLYNESLGFKIGDVVETIFGQIGQIVAIENNVATIEYTQKEKHTVYCELDKLEKLEGEEK